MRWVLFRAVDSKKISEVDRELFFQIDESFGDVLGDLIGGFVLIEIAIQRFYAHIATIGDEISDGMVGFMHTQLDVGLHPRHSLGNRIWVLTFIVKAVQSFLDLCVQLVVLSFAIGQIFFQHDLVLWLFFARKFP